MICENYIKHAFSGLVNNWSSTILKDVADYITPDLSDDIKNITERGELSVNQFVNMCDLLIESNPKWIWNTAIESKLTSYMPPFKQFLLCKQCVSNRRANETTYIGTHDASDDIEVIETWDKSVLEKSVQTDSTNHYDAIEIKGWDDLETNERDRFVYEELYQNETARYYDISITYDRYYRVPHVYLFGFNVNHEILSFEQMMQDISSEHVDKTVTYELHPFYQNMHAMSIHPCKHSNVMKLLLTREITHNDESTTLCGDHTSMQLSANEEKYKQYMDYFLKMLSTIIPSIEY
jgi:ubiquitin-like-conjugating enzyme ATG3